MTSCWVESQSGQIRRPDAAFFERHPLEVAPDLLGMLLVRKLPSGRRLVGRIVEVEAYLGDGSDPASHAHRGPTPRARSMFGPPGHFYVYRSMGIHHCINIVCQARGQGAAVLLRAVEPLEGLDVMRENRGGRSGVELTNGPGKLCEAFAIDLSHDATSALRGPLRVAASIGGATGSAGFKRPATILASPRVGISKAADHPYRFFVADHPCISRSPQNRRARTPEALATGTQVQGTHVRALAGRHVR